MPHFLWQEGDVASERRRAPGARPLYEQAQTGRENYHCRVVARQALAAQFRSIAGSEWTDVSPGLGVFFRMPPGSSDVTALLQAWAKGDRDALDQLTSIVHTELRRLARGYMRKERSGHVLQTTALVHEAYLQLIKVGAVGWRDRAHFFALSARSMRRILVDYARKSRSAKRGGAHERIDGIELNLDAFPSARRSAPQRCARWMMPWRRLRGWIQTSAGRRASVLRRPQRPGDRGSTRCVAADCHA